MTNMNPQDLSPSPAAASIPATGGAETPHRPPDDAEQVYFEGSPLVRGAIGKGILWLLAGLALIALAVASEVMKTRSDWNIPWWAELCVGVLGFLLIFVPIIRNKAIRYRVTNYRIDYERGLFSKDIDTLELWHVEDLRFHQSLLDRIMGVGEVTVISHDDTMPKLVLRSVPNPRKLYEELKQRVIAVKRSRGVIKMDPG